MPEESIIPLSDILTLSASGAKSNNQEYINIILEEEIPVFCVNNSNQKSRLMPFKVLYDNSPNFWNQKSAWLYYLSIDGYNKLKNKIAEKEAKWNKAEMLSAANDDDIEELEGEDEDVELGLGKEYKAFSKMTTEEKIECINDGKKRLNQLLAEKSRDDKIITEALVDTTKDAAMVNHAALEEAILLADDEAKKITQVLVDSTHEMVKSSAQLVSENIFNNELMNTLVEKSNGTIIQHMTRVYLNGIAFLSYYNNLVSTSSAIQKLRIKFASEYRNFYHDLLPHIAMEDIGLERVFYGGMRAIAPDVFLKWAVGFLIHDIGKANAVEYHEGEASYNRKIVIDHVKQGYRSIMTKTNYPMEASLITGYHHEYYGNSDGYGYFRAYLAQYKKDNPFATQDYCITYELEPIMDYQALAYFPAKVLEIIDVFDSVTDPHRVYRKAMTTTEALEMMRSEFVDKHRKIDIILFDIFSMFITEKEKQNNLIKK